MKIPYLTPEVLRRLGISAGVYTFVFVSFFFLSDVSTASSLGILISVIVTAVIVNLLSTEFDRLDVLVASGSMFPVFIVLEYLAFLELYSPMGVIMSTLKDIILYAGFSLITATLILYRMKPEIRMRIAKEREGRAKKEKVFYIPEKEVVTVSKPEISLLTGKEPEKRKGAERGLEELEKEFGEAEEPKKELPPDLAKAAVRIQGLIARGKRKDEVLGILLKAGFSKKEAQQIYEYASGP